MRSVLVPIGFSFVVACGVGATRPAAAQPVDTPWPVQPVPAQPPPAQPVPVAPAPSPTDPNQPVAPPPGTPPPPSAPPLQPGQIPPEAPPPPLPYPYPYYNYYNQQQPAPPQGPPPPPHPPSPEEPRCCRFAVRFNPFDLLLRRVSFQAEAAIWGPFSVEIEPSYIFGSTLDQVEAKGYALKGSAGFYLTAKAPLGFFIKAIVEYEHFDATVTSPYAKNITATGTISSPILGGLIGSSTVFGNRNVGFNISGGIGIGVATAGSESITTPVAADGSVYQATFYDHGSQIQLIGSLALGVAFLAGP